MNIDDDTVYEARIFLINRVDQHSRRYFHPIRVSNHRSQPQDKVVALLHDLVEDGDSTLDEIRVSFGTKIATAVAYISRRDNETYRAYIARLSGNAIAVRVKLADLCDNLHDLPLEKESLRRRYEAAQKFLQETYAENRLPL
jgi:(p)ppGpp synthase/HD superfamily hydrolase